MRYVHTGLVCSSEGKADRFYQEVLGLEKLNTKTLPAELSQSLFGQDVDLPMINYANDQLHFEVFISAKKDIVENQIGHTCIAVAGRDDLVKRCKSANLEVVEVPKGESMLVFIRDFDGNLFEVKAV